jgi:hypothetical protein
VQTLSNLHPDFNDLPGRGYSKLAHLPLNYSHYREGKSVQYKSVMVWSESGMMGGITPEHVTKAVQPALNKYSADGWVLHSQSICYANLVGVHLIFSKE